MAKSRQITGTLYDVMRWARENDYQYLRWNNSWVLTIDMYPGLDLASETGHIDRCTWTIIDRSPGRIIVKRHDGTGTPLRFANSEAVDGIIPQRQA